MAKKKEELEITSNLKVEDVNITGINEVEVLEFTQKDGYTEVLIKFPNKKYEDFEVGQKLKVG